MLTFRQVPGNQHLEYHVYGGNSKFCAICDRENPTSLLFCTISPDGELVHEFSVNSPGHPITGFIWHPLDPSIFFTQTNGGIITCHHIIEAEHNVEIIGTTDIDDNFILFKLNSTGTKMVVVLNCAETAKLYSLRQSEDGSMTFELDGSTGFDEIQITSVEFIRGNGNNIIAYGLINGTIHIDEIGKGGRMTDIVLNHGEILAVRFSPDGNFLAVAAEYGLSIYRVNTERFVFRLIGEFLNDNEDDFFTKVSLEWHNSLQLLAGIFVSEFSGVYGMSKIIFLSVSDFGVNQLHSQIFMNSLLSGIFIHPSLPLAIYGYYGPVIKGEILVWNFKDDIRFPLERLLLMRNSLYQRNLPEDVIEHILQETFGKHLSFQRFKHHCQLPPPLSASSIYKTQKLLGISQQSTISSTFTNSKLSISIFLNILFSRNIIKLFLKVNCEMGTPLF